MHEITSQDDIRRSFAARVRRRELSIAPGVFDMISLRVADAQGHAALYNGYIIVRDTEHEARQALEAIVAAGDWDAARTIMRVLGIESDSFNAQIDQFARRFVVGWGGFLFCGSPEQVVDGFLALERAGVEGMALMWHDPAVEIPYFAERVLPLMRAAGLRV